MINNIIGRPLSAAGMFFGYILLGVSGVLVILFGIFPSGLLMLVSVLMVSVVQGVQVNPVSKKVRSYISIFGIKKGKWDDLEKFPFLTVLRKNKALETPSINAGAPSIVLKSIQYEICLLTKNHFDRMLLKTVDEKKEAFELAEEYAEKLDKPIVEYHPKRSSERR
jgi:hypothetical protein